jgi:hypothetical protein
MDPRSMTMETTMPAWPTTAAPTPPNTAAKFKVGDVVTRTTLPRLAAARIVDVAHDPTGKGHEGWMYRVHPGTGAWVPESALASAHG